MKKVRLLEFSARHDWETTPPPPRQGFIKKITLLIACILGASLCITGLALPATLGLGLGVNTGVKLFEVTPTYTKELISASTPTPIRFLDNQGRPFAEFYSQNRTPAKTLKDVGDKIPTTLIATEDSRFYSHKGVDEKGIGRAVVANLRGSHQGASTITMQLVENLSIALSEQGSLPEYKNDVGTKIREVKTALEIEKVLSKDEILLRYLNTVYFGNNAFGIMAASHTYFNKPANELDWDEAALIIGLLKGPGIYDPYTHLKDALSRRNTVLWRLKQEHKIDEKQYETYSKKPLNVADKSTHLSQMTSCASSDYPYYCEIVRQELLSLKELGKTNTARKARFSLGGFDVKTGLDRTKLDQMNNAQSGFDYSQPWKLAGIMTNPKNGLIEAVSQTTTWQESQNPLVTSSFQVGSTMKPFVAAYALEKGFSPSQVFYSGGGYVSSVFDSPPGGYKNTSRAGNLTMDGAIKISNNVYFVKLLEKLGVKNTAQFVYSLGLKSIPQDLGGKEGSFALGVYEVPATEMASAYGVFANGGFYCPPHTITSLIKPDGKEMASIENNCQRVISAKTARTMNDLLLKPFEGGGTLGWTGSYNPQVRGKTGSTDDWALGSMALYSPSQVTYAFTTDPQNPGSNPLTNGLKAWGRNFAYSSTASGGETVYPYLRKYFYNYTGGAFDSSASSGDIIRTKQYVPPVNGLTLDSALFVLSQHLDEWTARADNECSEKNRVSKFDETTHTLYVCKLSKPGHYTVRDNKLYREEISEVHNGK